MAGSLTIRQGRLVLPDRCVTGDLVIEDGVIADIAPHVERTAGEVIDGRSLVVYPGVIDGHVHLREPGQTYKEDLFTGSRAAAAGGVTSLLDMPNTQPPITTVERLDEALALAKAKSAVHYGFFMGATGDNHEALNAAERCAGVKVFMAPSEGGLVIEDRDKLETVFANVNKLIAVHAEDAELLRERALMYADRQDVRDHPRVRDVDTALRAVRHAIELSNRHGRRLHLLHVSSAEEVDLLREIDRERITAEVCPHHLFLDLDAYERLGTRAQVDPPIRGGRHRDALLKALLDGTIQTVASDHAPHTPEEKDQPYPASPSGVPGVEWLMPLLLDRVHKEHLTPVQVARWLSENPARVFRIPRKGRLEVGYDGDIVLVDPKRTREITDEDVWTKCGWSPWAGTTLTGWPVLTAVLGSPVYRDGDILDDVRGRELTFER